MNAVLLENINKRFLKTQAAPTLKQLLLSFRKYKKEYMWGLRDINLSIEKGETVSIVGTNGSGKSTLLRIICGVYVPTEGKVSVNGRMSTMLELGSGFHPDLTGVENIYFNGAVLGYSSSEIRSKADSIIEFAELGDFINEPIRTYSAGMLMRLGFSIATETEPDILLIDEVLAVGDNAYQEKCYKRINDIKKQGKTVIFVTHDMKAAAEFAQRCIWIKKGSVYMDGKSGEIVENYIRETSK
ncbi:MAG: ABC transporter ATP-binding protein [Armatimonadetes bacterium]|nr:ABC transporter ATP-binding protein [Candidatus Hippobium faecium]